MINSEMLGVTHLCEWAGPPGLSGLLERALDSQSKTSPEPTTRPDSNSVVGQTMPEKSYATNLASEFYVLSVLYRLGFDASLTLGNKKAFDIVVVLNEGRAVTIDVKAVAGRNDWLLGNHDLPDAPGHFVILVGYEGAFTDIAQVPRLWVCPAAELQPLVRVAKRGGLRFVSRRAILDSTGEYENAWHRLRGG